MSKREGGLFDLRSNKTDLFSHLFQTTDYNRVTETVSFPHSNSNS